MSEATMSDEVRVWAVEAVARRQSYGVCCFDSEAAALEHAAALCRDGYKARVWEM